MAAPGGVGEVLKTLLMNLVSNPVDALVNANYIGILAWAVLLGLALKKSSAGTKKAIENISDALSQIVKWVISCGTFWSYGLGVHYNFSAGAGSSAQLWAPDSAFGGKYGLCGFCGKSDYCLFGNSQIHFHWY